MATSWRRPMPRLARCMQALEDAGLADDTLVVFTSDNGPEHYAYERVRKFDHVVRRVAWLEARRLGGRPSGADDRALAGCC